MKAMVGTRKPRLIKHSTARIKGSERSASESLARRRQSF